MTTTRLVFDCFGRLVLVERRNGRWLPMYPGAEGKHRIARDIPIPPELPEAELPRYLADLLHEWASPAHPDVRRVT